MAKCKYCKYFEYGKKIPAWVKNDETVLGRCCFTDRKEGNMTLGELDTNCQDFERWEVKYEAGQVFKGTFEWNVNYEKRTQERVFVIVAVQSEYAPNIYRIRDNKNCEYSEDEAWLDRKERIL